MLRPARIPPFRHLSNCKTQTFKQVTRIEVVPNEWARHLAEAADFVRESGAMAGRSNRHAGSQSH
ncbi:hypothetical protein D3870_18225 [Noviherbaspirillum cavernae]|uniref:Uncharacterized protein n=1 Tax=Noviherbaspirillum cavernae TaxID=2320862 RepID=A0A418X5B0_9BURK|nr:hypothetical protein D3870_18225 [Noviherbaspirillum cavernae]